MIRSIVVMSNQDSEDLALKRNLEIDHLEDAIKNCHLTWIDIVEPKSNEIEWLAEQFDLNPAVVEDLRREDRRPSLLVYPTYLFLSLFEPQIKVNRVSGHEIHCLMNDTCFITVRATDTESVSNAYNRVAQNPDAWHSGVAYCFYLTAQCVTDAYYPLLDSISNKLSTIEERLLEGDADEHARKPIYQVKQQLIKLRQMVAPQREVFSNMIGEKRLAEHQDTRDLFRHLYERLLRVYDVIDAQRDLSSNVLDMIQNQESRTLIEAVNRLTIFSMIFLPLTFFTSLFELNFATTSEPFMLPIDGGILFLLVISAMAVSATAMTYVFRRRGWL